MHKASAHERQAFARVRPTVALARVLALAESGAVFLDTDAGVDGAGQWARSTIDLDASCVGRTAVYAFEGGAADRPIVVGLLDNGNRSDEREADQSDGDSEVHDGERVIIRGKKEIVLSCGRASITLTRSGKILVRGAYVSSRSSGVNRILGGSVQIN